MISRATDYQTVTPVGVINGGILPARDNAANGSAHIIRAEDAAFAIEAANERLDVTGAPHLTITPSMLASMRRADWITAWRAVANLFNDEGVAVIGEPFGPIDFAPTSSEVARTLASMYPNGLESSAFARNTYFTSPALSSQAAPNDKGIFSGMRLFYYDLKRSDRLVFGYGMYSQRGMEVDFRNPVSGVWETMNSDTGEVVQHTYQDTAFRGDYFAQIHYAQTPYMPGDGMRYYKRLSDRLTGAGAHTVTLPLMSVVNADSVHLVALYGCYYECASASPTSGYCDFVRSYSCSISNGKVIIPSSFWQFNFDPFAYVASRASGVSMPDVLSCPVGQTPPNIGDNIIFEFKNLWMVATYDFRTEIRSLNWNWTP